MRRIARLRNSVTGGLRRAARSIALAVPVLTRDAVGLTGAGLVAYGVWLIHPPSGFIAAGLMLLIGAWLNAKAS